MRGSIIGYGVLYVSHYRGVRLSFVFARHVRTHTKFYYLSTYTSTVFLTIPSGVSSPSAPCSQLFLFLPAPLDAWTPGNLTLHSPIFSLTLRRSLSSIISCTLGTSASFARDPRREDCFSASVKCGARRRVREGLEEVGGDRESWIDCGE